MSVYMGIFRRSRTVEERALTRATTASAVMLPELASGEAISPDASLRNPDGFPCVRCPRAPAAALPLVAYLRTADGGRERFTGRLADLLQRPAPGTTTANLVGTLVAHLNLWGNAYVGKFRDGRGTVTQLAPLHPASVTPKIVGGEP